MGERYEPGASSTDGAPPMRYTEAHGATVPPVDWRERAEQAEAEVKRLRELLDNALALLREAECGILNAWDREKEAGEGG